MIFEAAKQLKAFPPSSLVKVDDTLTGIEEGEECRCLDYWSNKNRNLVALAKRILNPHPLHNKQKEFQMLKNF